MDLFTGDLDELTFADVEQYLAIHSPDDERPPEGSRIDYKREVPQDLAKDVAGLANLYGGLIFIGVKTKNDPSAQQNIPESIPGSSKLGNDAKAKLTNKLVTTMTAVPQFDIGICRSTSGTAVAVIRVQQGTMPPYECNISGKPEIPIRTQDSTRQAALADIQRLLVTREEFKAGRNDRVRMWMDSNKTATDLHAALIAPVRPLGIRLDSQFERDFRRFTFRQEVHPQIENRRGTQYSVELPDRVVGVNHYGELTLSAKIARREQHAFIGDSIDDLILFCKDAYRFLNWQNYRGNVQIAHCLTRHGTKPLAKFGDIYPRSTASYVCQSIQFPTQYGGLGAPTLFIREAVWAQLQEPYEIVADILLYQLREYYQAIVDYDFLITEMRARWASPIVKGQSTNRE